MGHASYFMSIQVPGALLEKIISVQKCQQDWQHSGGWGVGTFCCVWWGNGVRFHSKWNVRRLALQTSWVTCSVSWSGQGLYDVMTSLAKEQLMTTKLKTCLAEFALSEVNQKIAENSKYFLSFLTCWVKYCIRYSFKVLLTCMRMFPNSASQNWSFQVQITALLKVLLYLIIHSTLWELRASKTHLEFEKTM